AAAIGDFPEVLTLDDGGIFALRLDEIVPPTLQPLDEVRAAVISAWESAETAKALTAQAEALKATVEAGEDLSAGAVAPVEVRDVMRDAFLEDTPATLVTTVFDMQPGEMRVIGDAASAFLVRLDDIVPADLDSPEAQEIRQAFATQTAQGYALDMV